MRIAMIGTGYVGLVSGACFADFGHHVTCVDKDAGKIEALRKGFIPIYEPDLDRLVEDNMRGGRLDFSTDLQAPVAAAEEIAGALEGYAVVVTKSTVPVGTGREVEAILRRLRHPVLPPGSW